MKNFKGMIIFSPMQVLETERLYLRQFIDDDFERLSVIYADDDVMRFIGGGGAMTPEETRKSIEVWKKYYVKIGFGDWAIINKENSLLIGKCGFSYFQDKSEIELSYILAKEYWGRGLATEIAAAALNYGFEKLKLKRIAALVYPQNKASIKVLEKIGMKFEREGLFFDIKNKLLLYSAHKTDYI